MARKEPPKLPHNFYLPDGMNPTREMYQALYKAHKNMFVQFDDAATKIQQIETLLIQERNMRIEFQEEYERLINLHRKLPPGSLPVPEQKPQPLRIGDKGKRLSPVATDDDTE